MTSYQPGQRIALVHTDDPYTDLRPGDTGTVVRHDQAQHTINVNWDTGSALSMRLDAGDRIRLLTPAPGDDPAPGWTAAVPQLRVRGAEAGRDVADDWAQHTLAGLPAGGAQAVRQHLLAGIDGDDPGVLALLPTFTPPARWGEHDTAEIRDREAVIDRAHRQPEGATPAPGWGARKTPPQERLNPSEPAQTCPTTAAFTFGPHFHDIRTPSPACDLSKARLLDHR